MGGIRPDFPDETPPRPSDFQATLGETLREALRRRPVQLLAKGLASAILPEVRVPIPLGGGVVTRKTPLERLTFELGLSAQEVAGKKFDQAYREFINRDAKAEDIEALEKALSHQSQEELQQPMSGEPLSGRAAVSPGLVDSLRAIAGTPKRGVSPLSAFGRMLGNLNERVVGVDPATVQMRGAFVPLLDQIFIEEDIDPRAGMSPAFVIGHEFGHRLGRMSNDPAVKAAIEQLGGDPGSEAFADMLGNFANDPTGIGVPGGRGERASESVQQVIEQRLESSGLTVSAQLRKALRDVVNDFQQSDKAKDAAKRAAAAPSVLRRIQAADAPVVAPADATAVQAPAGQAAERPSILDRLRLP